MCILLGKCIAQYVLVLINVLFFIAGSGLAVVGGIALYNLSWSPQIEVDDVRLPIILAIVLGSSLAVMSTFGWCGACIQKKSLLYSYSAIALILAALQIYALVTIKKNDTTDYRELIHNALENAFEDKERLPEFHALEVSFGCCGPTGPECYAGVYDQLPISCCMNATDLPDYEEPIVIDRALDTCLLDDANPGCSEVLSQYITNVATYIGLAFIIVIAVEFLAIVMAISLTCCIATPKSAE